MRPATLGPLFVLGALFAALLVAGDARALSVNVQGYRSGGIFTPSDGSSVPVGAELKIRVWVDLYDCDPVTVDWGDGSPPETQTYGGSFSRDWTHTYADAGTYTITATAPGCSGGTSSGDRVVNVGMGGALGLLDPAGPVFLPALLGLIVGLAAVGVANRRVPGALPGGAPPPGGAGGPIPVPPGPPPPTFRPGIPASMTEHFVSLREVPPGSPRQFDALAPPRIPLVPGTPTDISQPVPCQFCGGKLGYTVAGWFCRNPACAGRWQPGVPRAGDVYGPQPLQHPQSPGPGQI